MRMGACCICKAGWPVEASARRVQARLAAEARVCVESEAPSRLNRTRRLQDASPGKCLPQGGSKHWQTGRAACQKYRADGVGRDAALLERQSDGFIDASDLIGNRLLELLA